MLNLDGEDKESKIVEKRQSYIQRRKSDDRRRIKFMLFVDEK